jgi:hypothetical protein
MEPVVTCAVAMVAVHTAAKAKNADLRYVLNMERKTPWDRSPAWRPGLVMDELSYFPFM